MDTGPPLNLSTSVRVEDVSSIKGEIMEEKIKNETYVYLQIEDKETQALTITGEAVEEKNLPSKPNPNSNQPIYRCPHCPNQFVRISQLKHHMKVHAVGNERSEIAETSPPRSDNSTEKVEIEQDPTSITMVRIFNDINIPNYDILVL